MNLTKQELTEILTETLTAFREEFDGDITASRILTLLAVSDHPGMQQIDVADYVKGLSASAISRNLVDWGDHTTARKPGPGFIEQRPDPMYRRRNLVYPTTKALHWLEQLTGRINAKLGKTAR